VTIWAAVRRFGRAHRSVADIDASPQAGVMTVRSANESVPVEIA
jgi:hypothetical protein